MKPIRLWRWICETGRRGNVAIYRATDPGSGHYGKNITAGYFVPDEVFKRMQNRIMTDSHNIGCPKVLDNGGECTCGLDDLVRELRGEG